jgi:ElaB/YqjD/DUF883 family membrane-anchored ribosome-binding protein
MQAATARDEARDRAEEAEAARAQAARETAARETAARADAEFEDALVRLATEIATLRRDFHKLIDQIGRVGDAAGHGARAAVQAAATEGWGASEQATAELGAELGGLRDDLVQTARQHPWRTLGLAAAAGVVLGFLMRR